MNLYQNPHLYRKLHPLSQTEAAFYQKLTARSCSILELGCGEGRLGGLFKPESYLGLDLSFTLLREHPLKASLVQGDWKHLPLKKGFDCFIWPLNGILHQDPVSFHFSSLAEIAEPRAILCLEWIPEKILRHSFHSNHTEKIWQVSSEDDSGMVLSLRQGRKIYSSRVYFWAVESLICRLKMAGFLLQDMFEDFEYRPFTSSSPRCLLLCHRHLELP